MDPRHLARKLQLWTDIVWVAIVEKLGQSMGPMSEHFLCIWPGACQPACG